MKARKKPVIVDVIQFKAHSPRLWRKCKAFVGESWIVKEDSLPLIRTLEGDMEVSDGDFIIKGVNGEFYPCKPDIFQKTYDIIPDAEWKPAPAEVVPATIWAPHPDDVRPRIREANINPVVRGGEFVPHNFGGDQK